MNVGTYLQRTYLLFFFSIGIGLTMLCNLVEFLERLVYTPHASLYSILTFVGLNSVATWLTLLPITAWLGMVATIYHLTARNEWHVCDVLGITPLRIATPLIRTLFLLMIGVSIAKHIGLDRIAHTSRTYYQRVFSKKRHEKVHTVAAQNASAACIATSFDQAQNCGRDITIYHYDATNRLTAIDRAPSFRIDPPYIHICDGTRCDPSTNKVTQLHSISLSHEPFILALTARQPARSLLTLFRSWWRTPSSQPDAQQTLLVALQEDIKPLSEAILLALFTLLLFLFFRPSLLLILSTYPLLLSSTLMMSYLCQTSPLTGTLLYAACNLALLVVAKAHNSRILRSI